MVLLHSTGFRFRQLPHKAYSGIGQVDPDTARATQSGGKCNPFTVAEELF